MVGAEAGVGAASSFFPEEDEEAPNTKKCERVPVRTAVRHAPIYEYICTTQQTGTNQDPPDPYHFHGSGSV